MSLEIARDVLALRGPARPGHIEFTLHRELMARATGLRADADPRDLERAFGRAWQIDLRWFTDDGPVPWDRRGRITDMGHAEFLADGSDRREARESPFRDAGEVLAFDAVAEYGLDDQDELARYYAERHAELQAAFPEQLVTGGYYHTMVTGATRAFGWQRLLEAAASPDRFERVLDSFHRLALHHARAWARTPIEAFICHDDMVWTNGPFMQPAFYRSAIIPRYRELWAELKAAGKRVIYCCDGDWSLFLEDIVEAGADGFIVEPVVPFERLTRDFGGSHVIVGSAVDCRTLTFGSADQVRAEVDRSLELGLGCPGWVCAVGNHIPANVPIGNAEAYFERLRAGWGCRGGAEGASVEKDQH